MVIDDGVVTYAAREQGGDVLVSWVSLSYVWLEGGLGS
jgi:hypothetical protein